MSDTLKAYVESIRQDIRLMNSERAKIKELFEEKCPSCGEERGNIWDTENCTNYYFHKIPLPIGEPVNIDF